MFIKGPYLENPLVCLFCSYLHCMMTSSFKKKISDFFAFILKLLFKNEIIPEMETFYSTTEALLMKFRILFLVIYFFLSKYLLEELLCLFSVLHCFVLQMFDHNKQADEANASSEQGKPLLRQEETCNENFSIC